MLSSSRQWLHFYSRRNELSTKRNVHVRVYGSEINSSAKENSLHWSNYSPMGTLYRYFVAVLIKLPRLSDNEVDLFTRRPRLWSCKHVQRIYRSITWYGDSCRDTSAGVHILWMWAYVCIVMATQYRKTAIKDGFSNGHVWPTAVYWLSTLRRVSAVSTNRLLD